MIFALATAAAITAQIGTFDYVEDRDAVTDKVRAAIVLRSDDGMMSLGCNKEDSSSSRVFFTPKRRLEYGNDFTGDKRLTFRFDDDKPYSHVWRTDGEIILTQKSWQVEAFAAELLKADKFIARLDGRDGQYVDLTFQVSGARDALRRISQACSDRGLAKIIDKSP